MKALVAAIVLCGLAARAEDRPVRVGASHHVDVIAPGEKVETVLDRMRKTSATPALPDARPQLDRAAPRAPDQGGKPGGDHGDHGGGPPEGPRPNGAAQQQPNAGPVPPHR